MKSGRVGILWREIERRRLTAKKFVYLPLSIAHEVSMMLRKFEHHLIHEQKKRVKHESDVDNAIVKRSTHGRRKAANTKRK